MNDNNYGLLLEDFFQKTIWAYERNAKLLGMNYTTLSLFQLIYNNVPCTQKFLCEKTFLPKQTVHSIIVELCKQEYVKLVVQESDKRNKRIVLTNKGTRFAEKFFTTPFLFDNSFIERLTDDEKRLFLSFLDKYNEFISTKLK